MLMTLLVSNINECDHIFYDFITTCISHGKRWHFPDIIHHIQTNQHDFTFIHQQQKYNCHYSKQNTVITLEFCHKQYNTYNINTNTNQCITVSEKFIPYIYNQLKKISFHNIQVCFENNKTCLYIIANHINNTNRNIIIKFYTFSNTLTL